MARIIINSTYFYKVIYFSCLYFKLEPWFKESKTGITLKLLILSKYKLPHIHFLETFTSLRWYIYELLTTFNGNGKWQDKLIIHFFFFYTKDLPQVKNVHTNIPLTSVVLHFFSSICNWTILLSELIEDTIQSNTCPTCSFSEKYNFIKDFIHYKIGKELGINEQWISIPLKARDCEF